MNRLQKIAAFGLEKRAEGYALDANLVNLFGRRASQAIADYNNAKIGTGTKWGLIGGGTLAGLGLAALSGRQGLKNIFSALKLGERPVGQMLRSGGLLTGGAVGGGLLGKLFANHVNADIRNRAKTDAMKAVATFGLMNSKYQASRGIMKRIGEKFGFY